MCKKSYYGGLLPIGSSIFDGVVINIETLSEQHKQGYPIYCSRCKTELLIALDKEEAMVKKIHAGVFCKKNQNHVCSLIELD
jgi:hypothetical protein